MGREVYIGNILSGLLLLLVFLYPPAFADEIKVVDSQKNILLGELGLYKFENHHFVRAAQLADVLSLSYHQNRDTQQFIFQIPPKKITITLFSPFITVGDKILQMPLPVHFRHDEFYVPVSYFLTAIRNELSFGLRYDVQRKVLSVDRPSTIRVHAIRVEEKVNGLLLRISLSEPITQNNLFTSESNNWFYVDLFGGVLTDKDYFVVENPTKNVKEIVPIQLSAETARLSFRINAAILSKQVNLSSNPAEVHVSLFTQDLAPNHLVDDLQKEREKWRIDTIIIDPGHGGKDPGAIGKNNNREKKITLDLAKQIKSEIERRLDVKVILTRDRDTFLPLQRRTKIANQSGGKLFISIHVDSNPNKRLRGHTVYFLGPAKTEEARKAAQFENSVIRYEESQSAYEDMSDAAFILGANAQNSYHKESEEFAALVDKQLEKTAQSKSHGVRQAGFFVLYGASMPNILLETGFISNSNDEERLLDKDFHRDVARAISNAILEFKNRYETLN